MITENFDSVFSNSVTIEEMFLIYEFVESSLIYFKTETNSAHRIANINFENIESVLQVLAINIDNYIKYMLLQLQKTKVDTTNFEKLIVYCSTQFSIVNLLGSSLPKVFWKIVLENFVGNYRDRFFGSGG